MKKVYLKDLQPDEVIRRLKAGEVVKDDKGKYEKKLIDGIICTIYNDKGYVINDYLISDVSAYFEEPEELKLEVGKCYRTRDGRKAFISYYIADIDRYNGIVYGDKSIRTWSPNGESTRDSMDYDIVAEWRDDDGKC